MTPILRLVSLPAALMMYSSAGAQPPQVTSEAGKRSAVAKGDARVLKTSAGRKSRAALGSVNDPVDHDFLTAQTPLEGFVLRWRWRP